MSCLIALTLTLALQGCGVAGVTAQGDATDAVADALPDAQDARLDATPHPDAAHDLGAHDLAADTAPELDTPLADPPHEVSDGDAEADALDASPAPLTLTAFGPEGRPSAELSERLLVEIDPLPDGRLVRVGLDGADQTQLLLRLDLGGLGERASDVTLEPALELLAPLTWIASEGGGRLACAVALDPDGEQGALPTWIWRVRLSHGAAPPKLLGAQQRVPVVDVDEARAVHESTSAALHLIGDLDGDLQVGFPDLARLLGALLAPVPGDAASTRLDLNGDGLLGEDDLVPLAGMMGARVVSLLSFHDPEPLDAMKVSDRLPDAVLSDLSGFAPQGVDDPPGGSLALPLGESGFVAWQAQIAFAGPPQREPLLSASLSIPRALTGFVQGDLSGNGYVPAGQVATVLPERWGVHGDLLVLGELRLAASLCTSVIEGSLALRATGLLTNRGADHGAEERRGVALVVRDDCVTAPGSVMDFKGSFALVDDADLLPRVDGALAPEAIKTTARMVAPGPGVIFPSSAASTILGTTQQRIHVIRPTVVTVGAPTTFRYGLTGGSGPASWQRWRFGPAADPPESTTPAPTVTFDAPGAHVVSLWVEGAVFGESGTSVVVLALPDGAAPRPLTWTLCGDLSLEPTRRDDAGLVLGRVESLGCPTMPSAEDEAASPIWTLGRGQDAPARVGLCADALGEPGGDGASLLVWSAGDLIMAPPWTIELGGGGDGGDATADCGVIGTSSLAAGGAGGRPALLALRAGFMGEPRSLSAAAPLAVRVLGVGGRGGDAVAVTGGASEACPAVAGGDATAIGGAGHASAFGFLFDALPPDGPAALHPAEAGVALLAAEVQVSASVQAPEPMLSGAAGGAATSISGPGSSASGCGCDGGPGGDATATGGQGGGARALAMWTDDLLELSLVGPGGEAEALAGDGGDAGVCAGCVTTEGGDGGDGGAAYGVAGLPGLSASGVLQPLSAAWVAGGDGGDGGAGCPPGVGGLAGLAGAQDAVAVTSSDGDAGDSGAPDLCCECQPDDGSCDDGDLCTTDTCDAGLRLCRHTPVLCDDGDPCTEDACDASSGGCLFTPRPCDDGDPCTVDGCLGGLCLFTPQEGAACDDGLPCTDEDRCVDGVCAGAPRQCPPVGSCRDGLCAEGDCVLMDAPDGRACDDLDPCTVGDACHAGGCKGAPAVCVDEQPCTYDLCVPGVGCVHVPSAEPGCCVVAADCDDGDPCTADLCDVATGVCHHALSTGACDDHDPCTLDDVCSSGACLGVARDCDDGAPCTDERCVPETGACVSRPAACADGDPCSDDLCLAGVGCVHEPVAGCAGCEVDADCDDGDACTVERCDPVSGACSWSPMVCPPSLACMSWECDPQAGACVARSQSCDDGDVCTLDGCAPSKGCRHVPRCDDGDDCTVDTCDGASGACQHAPVVCDDGDPCRVGACVAGGCVFVHNQGAPCDDGDPCTLGDQCRQDDAGSSLCAGEPLGCDDHDPCTVDACAQGACVHAPSTGAPCDDGDACTTDSACLDGACQGLPVLCDDQDPCTVDACASEVGCVHLSVTADGGACCVSDDVCADGSVCTRDACDALLHVCRHEPAAGPCDDGDPCTRDDACAGGACAAGPATCDDGLACTQDQCAPEDGACAHHAMDERCDDDAPSTCDRCDPASGCVHDAAPCDDGDACTADRCEAWLDGQAACAHDERDCDDGDACTVDGCDPASGACWSEPVVCDDGDLCTSDACDLDSGVCAFEPTACDDGDPCTEDRCDPASGDCVSSQRICDDGDPCTDDACDYSDGACVFQARDCDDGDICTDDVCGPDGQCEHAPRSCDDGDACTIDSCDPIHEGCQHSALVCEVGDPCTEGSCDPLSGDCVYKPRACDDHDPCTDDACDPTDGACESVPKDCSDGDLCTRDLCDPLTGACRHPPEACEDDDPCTDNWCEAATGLCLEAAVDCSDDDPCTDDDCDGDTGACEHRPRVCDDGDMCTKDACVTSEGGCVFSPIDCSDGDACTDDDCDAALGCTSTPVVCDDLDVCTDETCDPEADGCVYSDVDCDDEDPCTEDWCDALSGGCEHEPVDCNDSVACTIDRCVTDQGGCVFETMICDDEDPCTQDRCEEPSGVCVFEPIVCDDQDRCTVDACSDGACTATAVLCDDADPCTTDGCDPDSGECAHVPIVCDDHDACTDDVCDPDAGGCVHPEIDCEDGDLCTLNDCHPISGCGAVVACVDEDPCTHDHCDASSGACSHPPICVSASPCEAASCHPVTGACSYAPVDCDDHDPCTVDSCSALTDGCANTLATPDTDQDDLPDICDDDDDGDGDLDLFDCEPLDPAFHRDAAEICDGLDNDCDGMSDADDWDDIQGGYLSSDQPGCGTQIGACAGAVKPARLCVDGAWWPCDDAAYQQHDARYQADHERLCDLVDNDCDGATDEDFELVLLDGSPVWTVGDPCGVGACLGGVVACQPGGQGLRCPSEELASAEACDGVDNDCDGLVDGADWDDVVEGYLAHDQPSCELQAGVCDGTKKPVVLCVASGWITCDDSIYAAQVPEWASEEVCDGLDNNCDGATDEGFPDADSDGVADCVSSPP